MPASQNSLARPLGENLADMACEIIDQIFGQVVQLANSPDSESEKVIQQIMHNTVNICRGRFRCLAMSG